MSYCAAKRPQNNVHKLKFRNIVLKACICAWIKQTFFFAPSAVRPNSPVANEQNVTWHAPSSAEQEAKARADDRNPPSQDCSPHPAKKQHQSNKANKTENAKNGESIYRWLNLYKLYTNRHRTQRSTSRYWPTEKTPSSQGKRRDPNLQRETWWNN